MALTPLSTLLDRMDAYQTIANVEQQYKVRYLDEAIRALRRETQFPWMLQKSSLRVFDGVLEYPVAADHDELAYLDTSKEWYGARARFRYTSLQEFYEDPNNRNDLAEIWQNGTKFLGIRYTPENAGAAKINSGESTADWTASGTASTPTLDQVVFKEGSGSVRFTVTAGTATMTLAFTNYSDSNYTRKYAFFWVYLDAVPTSIDLRFGNDSSNYIGATVTTQFSGAAFSADQWNLVAVDLNGTATGTISSTAFDYAAIILNGATAGTYYVDAVYVRGWELLDYWYYSIYSVALTGSSTGNQEYFFNSSGIYATDSQLIGDSEWCDIILYDACLSSFADKENNKLLGFFVEKKEKAWNALFDKYPSMTPVIITSRWNFIEDHQSAMAEYDSGEIYQW